MNRRQHPRIPLQGLLTVCVNNREYQTHLIDCSVGGISATLPRPNALPKDERLVVRLDMLGVTLTLTASVVYCSGDRVGYRFEGMGSEAKSLLMRAISQAAVDQVLTYDRRGYLDFFDHAVSM